jgi:hypothetical protein
MADPRIFSLEDAERALPLVRKIVADVQRVYEEWRGAVASYELVAAGVKSDGPEPVALEQLRTEVAGYAEQMAGLIDEVQEIGCELKDVRLGLVDFYALLDDRLVYLCWRLGEQGITHWHELNEGYGGRQPIDQSLFQGIIP